MENLNKIATYLKNNISFYGYRVFLIIFRDFLFKMQEIFNNAGNLKKIQVYNFQMLVPLGIDGIGRGLYVYGGRELDHKWILEKVLKENDKIFELGANIGYYSMLENKILNSKCEIYAVEPDPRNIKVLSKNIEMFNLQGHIHFEQVAISNFSGEADLIFSKKTNLNRLKFSSDMQINNDEIIKVKVFDFCEYISNLPAVDLVRMDIEGAELEVFNSLVTKEMNYPNFVFPSRIIFETHNYGENKNQMKECLNSLVKKGYTFEYIASDDEKYGDSVFKKYGYEPIVILIESTCSRGIYNNIKTNDAIDLISNWKGTRTVCLKFQN